MVGRGGLGNPWLYRQVAQALGEVPSGEGRTASACGDGGPSAAARCAALLEHFDLEVEHQGERQAALNFRRIGAWYTAGLPGAKGFRMGVYATMDVGLIRRMIEDFFSCP